MYKLNLQICYKSLVLMLLSLSTAISLNAAPIKIMPVGDSITEGIAEIPQNPDQNISVYPLKANGEANLTLNADQIAYRGELWDLLKNEGYAIDFVGSKSSGSNYASSDFDTDHEGYGGRSSQYIKDNIASFMTNNSPDIVLLSIGTNDPGEHIEIGSYDDVDKDKNTSVNNIRIILNTIVTAKPNAKVLLTRILEAKRAHGWVAGWTTTAYNDKIEELLTEEFNSTNIRLVDMQNGADITYSPAGLPNDMQPFHEDNVSDFHPNAKGYAKMASKWCDDLVASGWLSAAEEDTTPPTITLLGQNPVNLIVGDTYTDAGATAEDTIDGNVTASIIVTSTVDTTTAGIYNVSYDVKDAAGNKSQQVKRTVNVSNKGDIQNNGWYVYRKLLKNAKVTPEGSTVESFLMVSSGLEALFLEEMRSISFRHSISSEKEVYIVAKDNGQIYAGTREGNSDSSTLKEGTFFKAGSKAEIKEENNNVLIEVTVKLNKEDVVYF